MPTDPVSGGSTNAPKPNTSPRDTDLPDSSSDAARLQGETVVMDMPEVSDIPGQENFVPAPLGELADTTISSDDEEGLIADDSDDLDVLNTGGMEDADDKID